MDVVGPEVAETEIASPFAHLPEQQRIALERNNYGSQQYWENRYAKEHTDEWLKRDYLQWSSVIEESTGGDHSLRILHPGCGNSQLSECMYDAGYHNIVNTDYVDCVVNQMLAKNKDLRPQMQWMQMDVTAMSFEDASFDIVVEKCLLDCLLCIVGVREEVIKNYFQEVTRILRPGGRFLLICSSQRPEHIPALVGHGFSIVEREFPCDTGTHFAYICRKNESHLAC